MTGRLLILMLLLLAQPAWAGVYRWVDESGRVHFTDKPPPGKGEEMQIEDRRLGSGGTRSSEVPDRDRLLQMYEKQRAEKQQQKAEKARRQAEIEKNCREVERTLRRYMRGGILYEDRPEGRYHFSEAEKQAEMAELRSLLDEHCDGVPPEPASTP